jgi:hypothetical protein
VAELPGRPGAYLRLLIEAPEAIAVDATDHASESRVLVVDDDLGHPLPDDLDEDGGGVCDADLIRSALAPKRLDVSAVSSHGRPPQSHQARCRHSLPDSSSASARSIAFRNSSPSCLRSSSAIRSGGPRPLDRIS